MPDPNARCAFCRRGPEGLDEPIGGLHLCVDEKSCEAVSRARKQRRWRMFRIGAFLMLAAIGMVEIAAWVVFR